MSELSLLEKSLPFSLINEVALSCLRWNKGPSKPTGAVRRLGRLAVGRWLCGRLAEDPGFPYRVVHNYLELQFQETQSPLLAQDTDIFFF